MKYEQRPLNNIFFFSFFKISNKFVVLKTFVFFFFVKLRSTNVLWKSLLGIDVVYTSFFFTFVFLLSEVNE